MDLVNASVPSNGYTADDIQKLEGLEPVRKRPGMYIGSTGPDGLHHLVYEIVDNSVDEAMAGYCHNIEVTVLADGGCRVSDDGRGIPVDAHAESDGQSAVEVVLSTLHSGGKFKSGVYTASGGLHGVGLAVVNALSTYLICEVDREDPATGEHCRWRVEYADGGQPKGPLQMVGLAPLRDDGKPRTGTTITFAPDSSIFAETSTFDADVLMDRFRTAAFLNAGLRITFTDERTTASADDDAATATEFHYPEGVVDYVRYLHGTREPLTDEIFHFVAEGTEDQGRPQQVEVAMQWNRFFDDTGLRSFVNTIPTPSGGTHEEGFRSALTSAFNKYARDEKLLPKALGSLQGGDIQEGLCAVVHARLAAPQFGGQTKSKLGNLGAKSLVQTNTYAELMSWLDRNPKEARVIVAKMEAAASARIRSQQVRDIARKSALEGAGLPGKLTDCTTKDRDEAELYIVEGDSAGGSAKDARDPATMAILPIRGKILNVERSRRDLTYENKEVQALISAIGAGVGANHEHEDRFNVDDIRYGKVILLCDADVDGQHIRTLLLTFFYREMTDLVANNHVYIAQPPLYSTKVGSQTHYLKDDQAKDEFLTQRPNHRNEFTRLKGLGEMDYGELWSTTMDPAQRTLLRVTVEDAALADATFSTLMGEDVEVRRDFIEQNALDVQLLDV